MNTLSKSLVLISMGAAVMIPRLHAQAAECSPNADPYVSNPKKTVEIGTSTQIPIDDLGGDDDSDWLTVSRDACPVGPAVLSAPGAASLSEPCGSFTLETDDNGVQTLTYQAPVSLSEDCRPEQFKFDYVLCDSHGGSSTLGTLTMTVTEKANTPPVAENVYKTVTAGDAAILIPIAELGRDTDAGDALAVSLASDPLTGSFGGKLTVVPSGLQYTPPNDIGATAVQEFFTFTLKDTRQAPADGNLTVEVGPHPCDQTNGGPGCFGQASDGKYYSEQAEKDGLVVSADGKKRLALFVPTKAAYLNPSSVQGPVIAIFPNPTTAVETYWGCGSTATSIIGTSYLTCNWNASLRGGITYVIRMPVTNGRIPRTGLNLTPGHLFDQFGAYFFALSRSPAAIAYSPTTGAPVVGEGDNALCVAFGSSAYLGRCPYLVSTKQPTTPPTQMLYLKVQPAPAKSFNVTKQEWVGTPGSACGASIKCRMYVTGAW